MTRITEYQNPFQDAALHQPPSIHDFEQLMDAGERFIEEEVSFSGVESEGHGFWEELFADVKNWEENAGLLLLSVADPTRTEWYRAGWFQDHEINPPFTDPAELTH